MGSRVLEFHVLNGMMEGGPGHSWGPGTDGTVTRKPLAYHRQVTEPEGSHVHTILSDPRMGSTRPPAL